MSDKLIEAVARAVNDVYADHDIVPYHLAVSATNAALSAIEASGYRVVPKEPTEEMLTAAFDDALVPAGDAIPCYDAMLSASPKVTP